MLVPVVSRPLISVSVFVILILLLSLTPFDAGVPIEVLLMIRLLKGVVVVPPTVCNPEPFKVTLPVVEKVPLFMKLPSSLTA